MKGFSRVEMVLTDKFLSKYMYRLNNEIVN